MSDTAPIIQVYCKLCKHQWLASLSIQREYLNQIHGFHMWIDTDSHWMGVYRETGTVWLKQWLIFQSLILDSTHRQNSGKFDISTYNRLTIVRQ